MLSRYRHRQIGYLTITALGAAFIMTAYLIISTDEARWIPFLVTAILIMALVFFTTLTVTFQYCHKFSLVRLDGGELLQGIILFLPWSPHRVEIRVAPEYVIEMREQTVF